MTDERHAVLARAFDDLAPAYDVEVGGTVGAALAKAEATKLLRSFRPGDLVLDVGCGTGVDACRLASRGVRVIASDVSEGMLEQTRQRAARDGVERLVLPRRLAASELSRLASELGPASLDGAYSFFGSLNLEPEVDAARRALAKLLKPGAPFYAGLVNRRVLWEWTVYPLMLRFDKPLRKIGRQTSMRVSRAREDRVPVQLFDPSEFADLFEREFETIAVEGCNIVVPPPYLDKYARKLPGLLRATSRWEDRLRKRAPWNAWGYFTILTMRRRSA